MKLHVFLLTWLTVFACYDGLQSAKPRRSKRDAAGALHIVTNHAQPIHADVKAESAKMQVIEKVTPPEDTFYQTKSLRKSLEAPGAVELTRTIVRAVTLLVLVVSAVFEFYPLLRNLYHMVYSFLYL